MEQEMGSTEYRFTHEILLYVYIQRIYCMYIPVDLLVFVWTDV